LSLQLRAGSGWRLLTAQSAGEAVALIPGEKIDVALLDLLLPDGNGIRLGQKLQTVYPNIRVVIMTGGSLTLEDEQARLESHFQLIEKPFLAEEVLRLTAPRTNAAAVRQS